MSFFLQQTNKKVSKTWFTIEQRYPKVDKSKMTPIGFKNNKRVAFGRKSGLIEVFNKDGTFRKHFIERNKDALGPKAEDIIAENDITIRKEEEQLENVRKIKTEMQDLRNKIEKNEARINALEDEPYSNNEDEIKRLRKENENHQATLET